MIIIGLSPACLRKKIIGLSAHKFALCFCGYVFSKRWNELYLQQAGTIAPFIFSNLFLKETLVLSVAAFLVGFQHCKETKPGSGLGDFRIFLCGNSILYLMNSFVVTGTNSRFIILKLLILQILNKGASCYPFCDVDRLMSGIMILPNMLWML